jgi:hypothetical protein
MKKQYRVTWFKDAAPVVLDILPVATFKYMLDGPYKIEVREVSEWRDYEESN